MKLYHESIGSGETVVFVHSGMTDSRMWNSQWEALQNDYRLVRYDRPAFGKTAPSETIDSRADLLMLMDKLDIKKAHLVGSSMGGEIIVDFALENPERVKSLVLVGSVVSGFEMQGEPPAEVGAFFSALQAGKLEEVAAIANQMYLVGGQRRAEQIPQALRDFVYEMTLNVAQNGGLMQQEAHPLAVPAIQQLGEITVPTLLMVGEYEHPEVKRAAKLISEEILRAQVLEIANTAHFPNIEAPEAFNQALREFLSRIN